MTTQKRADEIRVGDLVQRDDGFNDQVAAAYRVGQQVELTFATGETILYKRFRKLEVAVEVVVK